MTDSRLRIGLGVVHSHDSWVGRSIVAVTTPLLRLLFGGRKATAGTATHVYVWFGQDNGTRVYYEALMGKGWKGPFPIDMVRRWSRKPGRWNKEFDLTPFFTQEEIERRRWMAHKLRDVWIYHTRQLALQLRLAGIPRRLVRATPFQVICSEAGSRLLHNEFLDFREFTGRRTHDNQSPEQLHQACKVIAEKLGTGVRITSEHHP